MQHRLVAAQLQLRELARVFRLWVDRIAPQNHFVFKIESPKPPSIHRAVEPLADGS